MPKQIQKEIKQDVGEFLVEQVLLSVGESKSPVTGEAWPGLSKKYMKEKVAQGGVGKANMELTGDMLNALDYKVTPDGIELAIYGKKEAPKADGHLKFSGAENNTPQRRFIPGEGQSFKDGIESQVQEIIADKMAETIDREDLTSVKSSHDLYEVLGQVFEDMSKPEIRLAALRSEWLRTILEDMDLLDFL